MGNKAMGFNIEIQYRPGLENKAADALSRLHSPVELTTISSQGFVDSQVVNTQVEDDPFLSKIKKRLQEDSEVHPQFSVEHGRLLYKGRLALPQSLPLIAAILSESHSSPTGGHSGFLRTYKRLTSELYWVGMKRDIKKFVEECPICQQSKNLALSPAGLLQPLPIPHLVWEDISMDFIEGLPKSGGYNSLLVVVDRLRKYAHFLPIKHPFTAESVATLFVKEIVRLHGIPNSIVSDRDKVFVSRF